MILSSELTRLWKTHASALVLLARSRCGDVFAEDCVQDAFVRLAAQSEVPDDCVAWLVRVVRNAAIDAARSGQRRAQREKSVGAERFRWFEQQASPVLPAPDDLEAALRKIDELTREIIIAHIWNNLSFRQIALVFEMSSATVHRRYEDGIAELRRLLCRAVALEVNAEKCDEER